MANAKHKNQSKSYHSSRTRVKSSSLSRAKNRERNVFSISKKLILTVITLSSMIVILAVLFVSFANPEKTIKNKIESMATSYYESYFYPEIVTNNLNNLSDVFEKYTRHGFSAISLRQLLLLNDEEKSTVATELSNYCDLNDTYIQIFPESPFEKENYRIDYHYSCVF